MRRTLVFLEHQAQVWEARAGDRGDCTQELLEGLVAYAKKQAAWNRALAEKFKGKWRPLFRNPNVQQPWQDGSMDFQSDLGADDPDSEGSEAGSEEEIDDGVWSDVEDL